MARPDQEIPTLRLSGFAPAIASLLALGLPAKRLANIFGVTSNYIYVLANRGRLSRARSLAIRGEGRSSSDITSLAGDTIFEPEDVPGIRPEEDAVEFTRSKAAKLDRLDSRMSEIVSGGRNTYRFLQAARALTALKPFIGYPSESNRLRLTAKLHQHLAWCYSHSGFARSSIAEASYSVNLYEIVYDNTGDKDVLRELGGSCLIRSNSQLLQGDAKAGLTTLNLAREATGAADHRLNSDYFRQFGVALFQIRQDANAKKMFRLAMETTPDGNSKNGKLPLRMASGRHLNLIATPFPEVDDEMELLDEAKAAYGPDSLEAAMCVHWAAACALCTDSPKAQALALELILENQSNAKRFGHQTTIAKLLPIALELPMKKRPLWVRFALY